MGIGKSICFSTDTPKYHAGVSIENTTNEEIESKADDNETEAALNNEQQDEESKNEKIEPEEQEEEKQTIITPVTMEDKGSYYLISNNLNPEIDRDVVSILALSDTMSSHSIEMMQDIPPVDILIHAGNFTG